MIDILLKGVIVLIIWLSYYVCLGDTNDEARPVWVNRLTLVCALVVSAYILVS